MDVIIDNLPYLMVGTFPNGPLGGLALTIWLALAIGAAALLVGVVVACLSLSPYRAVRWFGNVLTLCIRGVPSVAFLFWMYFLVPRMLNVDLTPFQSVVIALALYQGAYMAEDIRGGFEAVPHGQWEAGRATGLGSYILLRHIIFPQAIRAVIPALVNRFVNLFMYTSIVSMLGIIEFTRAAVLINNRELIYPLQIFGFVGFVYFVCCSLIGRLGRHLERRWAWAPKISSIQAAT